jgi:hypothetical protein
MNRYLVTGREGQDVIVTVGFYFSNNFPNPLYKKGDFLIVSLPPVGKGRNGGIFPGITER